MKKIATLVLSRKDVISLIDMRRAIRSVEMVFRKNKSYWVIKR